MRKTKPKKPWTPFQLVTTGGRPQWASCWLDKHPEEEMDAHYQNSRYMVGIKRTSGKEDAPDLIHLSIRALDRTAQHDWREFQRIKTELLGPEQEAVELYPAESRHVDCSNQYHLWCVDGVKWPFGFNERAITNTALPGAVQRPHEEPPADCIMTREGMYERMEKAK